jgi:2'-5' RNA ligase
VAERLRVFFALWPPADAAAALHAEASSLAADCGGRAMRRETLHLTLAFVGEVATERLGPLIEAGAEAASAARSFRLLLDRRGLWRHKHILWLAPAEPVLALEELADALAEGLRARGFALEKRKFRPHLTLLRKAGGAPETQREWPGVAWQVGDMVLVASERLPEGAHYRVLARWPLG